MDDGTLILIEIGAVLLGMSLLGRLAARIGLSPIPLYLLFGLAFGTGGLLPLHEAHEFFETGADIGVLLLLALLGLEYSPAELVSNLRQSKYAGAIDFLLNALPGAVMALLLGWGPLGAVALAGVTWVSSSGVIAKVLRDLGRVSNRETPAVLSILVIEDLAMAFYLPVLTAVAVGVSLWQGAISVGIAVGVVLLILFVAFKWGHVVSRLFSAEHQESLLLGVLGLTMLVAGLAEGAQVSGAVGAFLVGIALSGRVAREAESVLTPLRDLFAAMFFVFFGLTTDAGQLLAVLLPAVVLAIVTMATKVLTGYLAARRAGIGVPGRWRSGLVLVARGEFSVVIAGLAVGAGAVPELAPLATAYVLITILVGSFAARITDTKWFKARMRQRALVRR
ncbi:cation:proton antiporter [Agromyces seonyuensis]|uniref:Cation:proton antiporter n=1 Tax=Agromyces seonyuensis TaxID=2662446 RepID=A0A6I4P5Q4_9MICO|nr:cation:proton antiporter [Agromyces seonyuensis]MWB98897.1 cation:proton antiporter [Agromyces seonyuensis]